LATLPDAVTQERLDNQKAVVRNERRQKLENEPYGLLDVLLHENLYPAGHPYSHSVIGSHDDVQAASIADVKEFFSSYYAPNNLSMAIVGDFNPADTKRWIAKYFGPIPPGPPIARPARWTPQLQGEKVVDISDHVAEVRTYLVWSAPGYVSADKVPLELAARILNRRLSAALVYSDPPLCSEVSVDFRIHEDASEFVVMVSARAGSPFVEVERKVDAAILSLAKAAPSEEELRQTRRRVEYAEISQFDTLQSTAETLNRGMTLAGDPNDYVRRWNEIERTTPEQLRAAAQQWLGTPNRVVLRFHPESMHAKSEASVDRSLPPPIRTAPKFEAPKIASSKLPNGLQVFVAQRKDVPKVAVLLLSRSGAVLDPPGKVGLALMTVATMPTRTTTRSGTQIRDSMEAAGANKIESSVSVEAAGLGFEALSSGLVPAFSILADVALHPAFKEYSIETNRRQFQDALAESRTEVSDIADGVTRTLVFGPGHPYARPLATEAGLASLSREDLSSFYGSYFKPDSSALIFAGDISLDQAVNLAQKYLSSWAGHAAKPAPIPAPQDISAGRVYLIDKPDAPQTLITQILPGVGPNSPDRHALSLVTAVWGNMWGSRLSQSLREGEGYTYGFSAAIGLYGNCGTLAASGTVQTDKTKESVIELINQLRLLHNQPISEAELQEAKRSNLSASTSSLETTEGLASRMGQLWAWDLPMSALQGETDAAQATSLAAVRTAVAHYMDPAKATLLLVGDRSKIEPGLRELNLGEVTLLDANGQPVAETTH
jgi:zinc protease